MTGFVQSLPGLLYVIVGGEGATNFPRDELHIGFKQLLIEKGFRSVHVEKANYLNWDKDGRRTQSKKKPYNR